MESKDKPRVSMLMLERYHLGEIGARDRELVEAELLGEDAGARDRLSALIASDRELRLRYPAGSFAVVNRPASGGGVLGGGAMGGAAALRYFLSTRKRPLLRGLCAAAIIGAALFLCVLFPVLYFHRGEGRGGPVAAVAGSAAGTDRLKGAEVPREPELFVYLKDDSSDSRFPEVELQDEALLREGNTVQLAYTLPPGGERYGVIFSIDGRSVVTLHYPYRAGQSALLTVGKKTFLREAYTLDDAPELEIFFMVVSDTPLEPGEVLGTAGRLARNPRGALAESEHVFSGYEVETVIIRKAAGAGTRNEE
jgi:hypothetical protein